MFWQKQSPIAMAWMVLSILSTRGAPFKTSEERIPSEVREAVTKQIRAYFKTNEVLGVPIVDPKIDWNDLSNWPDEFAFRGETYALRLIKGINIVGQQVSRAEAKVGLTFCANYRLKGSDDWGRLQISAVWFEDGSVLDKSVRAYKEPVPNAYENYVKRKSDPNIRSALGGQYHSLFQCRFYRTGGLYSFVRSQGSEFRHTSSFFDRNGRQVGGPGLTWDGREVDGPKFYELAKELFQADPAAKLFAPQKR